MSQRNEYYKQYYVEHKEAIKNRLLNKVPCEHCQKMITKVNMKAHQTTQKCLRETKIPTGPNDKDLLNDLMKRVHQLETK